MTEQPAPGGCPAPGVPPLPPEAYTPWLSRVLAWVIDILPVSILLSLGYGLLLGVRETVCNPEQSEYDLAKSCGTGASTLGQVSFVVAIVLAVVYLVWNYGYRQGTTGSSIGKGIMKFKVVSESQGQPIGFGKSLVRQLAHGLDAVICYIGFLLPLWDSARRTLADRIMKTVCLPL